ncbi:MAG: chitobiase/beta-hexosaminidase C-terminal domain-containing protein [Verrucomicrobiota bacterium]
MSFKNEHCTMNQAAGERPSRRLTFVYRKTIAHRGGANAVLRLKSSRPGVIVRVALAFWAAQFFPLFAATVSAADVLAARLASKAYLSMPSSVDGPLPPQLSQTGAFKDLLDLVPSDGLVPYDLVVAFWSDGAEKSRWISEPAGQKIRFAPTGEWGFPQGTIFVKQFDLATDETNPSIKRRLETRLLVCNDSGGVYGVTYKWRADNSDADLLATNLTEPVALKTATGVRTQMWYYPSRQDCLTCHTANAGYVLGVKTRQMNREFTYPSGVTENELKAWSERGMFDTNLAGLDPASLPKLAARDDTRRSLEDRARSFLDANCAHCHRPEGTVAYFDARYDTPLARQGLVAGRVLIDERIDAARVIAPNDVWRSILYLRANTTEAFKMPPLARNAIDQQDMELLRQWIESLPGPPVLPPPEISPRGGNFTGLVTVILKSEPGATIRYTVDGTVPTSSDLLYEKPIQLTGPTILRARAFKPGFTKSIGAKEIFLIGG